MKKLLFLLAVIGASFFISPQGVLAATFDKNRLIVDSLFVDTNSMTVQQIQDFLESKGSLLANWVDNVTMRRPSDNCIVHHPTGMTAAEIIHEASTAWGAQVYNGSGCAVEGAYWSDPEYSNYTLPTVSPKVLLVTLQKEQSLITANGSYSSDPNAYKSPSCCTSNEYKLARAMGYGVPDSGSINEKYLGFYNQINWAAWQLRYNYERSGGNTDWDEVGYLTYTGPMIEGTHRRCASCAPEQFDGYYTIDGSPLYMDNRATASLYYYTPHTYDPDDDVIYYGNYNFVQFYSDWFGSTLGSIYSIESISTPPFVMTIDESYETTIVLKNISDFTWYSDGNTPQGVRPFRLMTDHYYSHQFADEDDPRWLGTKNQIRMIESSVPPDGLATFSFNLKAVSKTISNYHSRFYLVQDGIKSYREPIVKFSNQTNWDYAYSYVSSKKVSTVLPGDLREIEIRMMNVGQKAWYADGATNESNQHPVRISTLGYLDSPFAVPSIDDRWLNTKNQIRMFEATVLPGEIATFRAIIGGPKREMLFTHKWRLVVDGLKMGRGEPVHFNTYTPKPNYSYSLAEAINPPRVVSSSESFVAILKIRNLGNTIWVNDERVINDEDGSLFRSDLRMVTSSPTYRNTIFADGSALWLSTSNQVRMKEQVVIPGHIGTFEITFNSDLANVNETYSERFKPVLNGVSAFKDRGFNFEITVVD